MSDAVDVDVYVYYGGDSWQLAAGLTLDDLVVRLSGPEADAGVLSLPLYGGGFLAVRLEASIPIAFSEKPRIGPPAPGPGRVSRIR